MLVLLFDQVSRLVIPPAMQHSAGTRYNWQRTRSSCIGISSSCNVLLYLPVLARVPLYIWSVADVDMVQSCWHV